MDLSVAVRNPTPYQLQLHRERQEREVRLKRAAVKQAFERRLPVLVPLAMLKKPAPKPVKAEPPKPIFPVKMLKVKPIINHVSKHYGKHAFDVIGPCRTWDLIWPRFVTMYMLHRLTKRSFPQIGRDTNRDHTSVLYGVRRVQVRMMLDGRFYFEMMALESELSGELRPVAFLPPPVSKTCLSSANVDTCAL